MWFGSGVKKAGYTAFFLGPALLFFTLVVVFPFLLGIYYSMTSWNGVSSKVNWVGIRNYITIFQDEGFRQAFWFTLKYTVVAVVLQNVIGFFLAVFLVQKLKLTNLLRTVFFVPNVIAGLLLGFIWQFIFTRGFSAIGKMTGWWLFELPWLGTPNTGFWGIVIVSVWQMSGYLMVIYIAGLNNISPEINESAALEGAGFWQKLVRIDIPMVMSSVTVCLFLSISWAFKIFDLNYSLTNGGPYGSTESMALDIYNDAFLASKYGIGTAKAMIFFLIVGTVTLLQVILTSRKEVNAR